MQEEATRPAPEGVPATASGPVAVNVGIATRSHGEPIDDAERERRRQALDDLLELMRPAVQADGGDIALVDVDYETGVVEVQLQGACGSCAISAVTLQGGVERLLKERLAWVTEVAGGVDDSVDPFESAALGRGGYVPRSVMTQPAARSAKGRRRCQACASDGFCQPASAGLTLIPGGTISSRRSSVPSSKTISQPAIRSCSWSMVLGPMMAAVTAGCDTTKASARCLSDVPASVATASS